MTYLCSGRDVATTAAAEQSTYNTETPLGFTDLCIELQLSGFLSRPQFYRFGSLSPLSGRGFHGQQQQTETVSDKLVNIAEHLAAKGPEISPQELIEPKNKNQKNVCIRIYIHQGKHTNMTPNEW